MQEVEKDGKKENGEVLGSSRPSGDGDGNVKNMLVAKGWSQEESVEGIIEFIVLEEIPFSIVENEGFRRMMCKVQPRLHVPSRRTMMRELFNMYDSMKDQLKKEIHNHRVMCISVDNASTNKVAIELDTSVDGLRNAVRFVRSSPRRLSYFKKCVESEKLDSRVLVVMDVPTRWNSTYMMLESCMKFQKVFERMIEDDEANIYTTYFSEKVLNDEGEEVAGKGRVGPLKEEDWDSAEVFVKFWKAFYLITLKVSASKYPTSNTVYDVIVVGNEIEKLFLPEYMQTGKPVELVLHDMAFNMRAKYRKYFGSIESHNQIFVVALVLDPRFILRHYMHLCRKQLQLSEEEIEQKSNEVKTLLKAMCDEYAFQAFGSQTQQKGREDLVLDTSFSRVKQSSSSVPTENPMIFSQIMDDWEKELEDTEDIVLAHEVDRYLLDTVEKVPQGSQFDVLKWWKLKGRSTYPTLALVVKDVLLIQVSIVANESAFSARKRVIHPCRSCLLP
ncbi:hypothetical protein ACFX12_037953 [Malus domestica]